MAETCTRPLKILFTSQDSIGHLNSCLGIGLLLSKRGHDVYFASYLKYRPNIEKNGLKFISLSEYQHSDFPIQEHPVPLPFFRSKFLLGMKFNPLEMMKDQLIHNTENIGFASFLTSMLNENYAMLNIVDHLKPDICLADYLWVLPWMVKVDVPVVPIMSTAPNDLWTNGPPLSSGYSINDPPELWAEFRALREKSDKRYLSKNEEMFRSFGTEYAPRTYAKELGIYVYPSPLDYKELGPPMKNWIRLDSAVRIPESTEFDIPDKLKDKPGSLIYVSMGTLASSVPELMDMIVSALSKSKHRFIMSTGPNGDTLKLPENVWGDTYVNQIAILPHVDLFITHGGSNSLIEGLSACKPLLVIPQFGDQFNNGQRIVDLGLGGKINLWEFNETKLIKKIDLVLNDKKVLENVLKISEELKRSDSSDYVCTAIEKLGRSTK